MPADGRELLSSNSLFSHPRASIVVVALAALLFAWNIGGYDVWAPDEPYFAEGAREMIADGQGLVPHINGRVSTDKPALFFWLIALISWPLGTVTAATARLPSILAALGTILLTMRLARRYVGADGAPIAGIVLATAYMFWDKARSSQIDGRRAGLLFWAAMVMAVLAKGPVGLLLPLGIALTTRLSRMDLAVYRVTPEH